MKKINLSKLSDMQLISEVQKINEIDAEGKFTPEYMKSVHNEVCKRGDNVKNNDN